MGISKSCGGCFSGCFQHLAGLPWKTVALAFHAILYITLSVVMLVSVDNYQAYDVTHPTESPQAQSKLRSGDIITAISAASSLTQWAAGVWAGQVFTSGGYLIWMKTRESQNKETITDKIRWTMEFRLPIKLDWGFDYTLIRLSILIIIPALLASPVLNGALSWKSSAELAAHGVTRSGNPGAQFWNWNFLNSPRAIDAWESDELWKAASMANIAWENGTRYNADGEQRQRQACRHVVTHAQFQPGAKLYKATIPCIVVHSVSWPTEPMPDNVGRILNSSTMVSVSQRRDLRQQVVGAATIFDPTNQILPLPPVLGGSNITYGNYTVVISQPVYPTPFRWAGTMTAIVKIKATHAFYPYMEDIFGMERPNNNVSLGNTVIFDSEKGEVLPEQTFTYLHINFTAGVVNPATSTYVKADAVEADSYNYGNDTDGVDIRPAPWVREALYMTSDVMSCLASANSTLVPTWHNLEQYTETMLRFSYMASWTYLQHSYDPNSTDLRVDIYEPRLQAVVTRWRVVLWLVINAALSCSWLTMAVLRRRNEELVGVSGVADFLLRLYEHFDLTREEEEEVQPSGEPG
ncbi:hypothetical protein B0H66DRAFT_618733 [Apodospora peruviana]|uniref:Uncharacterized protein n=1 Tax=Apodospora peruviana TaxID=516989 RepID=A0AAE0IAT4_9PEZI|nr:hypothetical protein B0H66DRAFT_618733 [Apodospora peruviana]